MNLPKPTVGKGDLAIRGRNNMTYQIPEKVSKSMFRAYDIRGVVGEDLTADSVYAIGLAIGSEADSLGLKDIALARDGRLSGPELSKALIQGLMDSGRHVTDIGAVPTPLLYFATHHLQTHSGVMLTGSHNPANYNGIKMVLGGETLTESAIEKLHQRINQHDFVSGEGTLTHHDIEDVYIQRICSDINLPRQLHIVINSGTGITGHIAPKLFKQLGCKVTDLFCQVDGNFPHHHPDPANEKNLKVLITTVRE